MSNYTPVTNFLAKDSLISGNPAKLIKGADLTTEFAAVQAALNSKIDGVVQFFTDGNAGQPSVGFTSSAGTGMYNAAGVLGLATGGVQRIAIAAAGAVTITPATTITGALTANGGAAITAGSGAALSVTGAASADGARFFPASSQSVVVFGATSDGARLSLVDGHGGVGTGEVWSVRSGVLATSVFDIFDASAGASRLSIDNTGGVTVHAPNSGTDIALTINGDGTNPPITSNAFAAFTAGVFNSSNATGAVIQFQRSGVAKGYIGNSGVLGGATDNMAIRGEAGFGVDIVVNGGSRVAANFSAGAGTTLTPSASNQGLTVNANTNAYGIVINQQTAAGTSFGALIQAGTNTADFALQVNNAAVTANYLLIRGDGSIYTNGQTPQGLGTFNAGALFTNAVNASASTGSFTGTFTGFTAGVTGTCNWFKQGSIVTLFFPATANGTSNATTFTMTGLPAAIQPATLTGYVALPFVAVKDNGGPASNAPSALVTAASGTIQFALGSTAAWTITGLKGFTSGASISYSVL